MTPSTETPPFELTEAISLLRRTPEALEVLLRGLPDVWVQRNEGERGSEPTWTAYDIVGHLASTERADWMPRVLFLLEHGESAPFPKVDRFAQFQANEGKSLEQLLQDFVQLRRRSLESLEALRLQPRDLSRVGTHPVFGAVTLGQLLATWTTHDLNHLHQLTRVMAYQYREAVGPWQAYLGVLHCDGHGAA